MTTRVWTIEEGLAAGWAASEPPPTLMGSKSISSAQLLDWHNTPVELLPAAGGRLYYVLQGFVLHYRFVTTPYNENIQHKLVIGFGSDLATLGGAGYTFSLLEGSLGLGAFFTNTEDYYASGPALVTGNALAGGYFQKASFLENQAVSIGMPLGGQLTGGDGTLTVRTFYSLIDGAP